MFSPGEGNAATAANGSSLAMATMRSIATSSPKPAGDSVSRSGIAVTGIHFAF
jgi:hypothetical protein